MKRATLVLFYAALANAGDTSGIWKLVYTTENGLERASTLDLKVEGDHLSGTLASERGRAAISNGTVSGDSIAFDLVRDARYDVVTVHFKGRIAGDIMKLTMQYGKRSPIPVIGKKGS